MEVGLKFSLPRWAFTKWLVDGGEGTPTDIRVALIASLFGTLPIFAGGVINTLLVSAVVTWSRPEPLFLSWLVIELVLAVVRVAVLRSATKAARYGRSTHTDIYIVLALFWAASVGYGVFITFLSGDWVLATLAGVSCAAMAGGICFRNYGAPRLVGAMIFLSMGPMCVAALFTGEPVTAVVFFQIPFYLISMSIASYKLNRILVSTMLAERENERRARLDPLTGLANRGGLMAALAQTFAEPGTPPAPSALLYLDLDDFKIINDTYGHAAGDEVLQNIGQRMKSMVRSDDVVARFGGDEFVVLAKGIDPLGATYLGDQFLQEVRRPILLSNGVSVSVGLAVGIALIPKHGNDVQSILDTADAALYVAKSKGGGCWSMAETVCEDAVSMDGRLVAA